ncbi:hypothetical protein LEP1GSC197_0879 [Leptospira interrogans serovar Pomona str. CSL4002]|nr:hypothetical protein LEP1GSC197_0879 [Leptospira interrogans serovar Pomona str. CSL4002]
MAKKAQCPSSPFGMSGNRSKKEQWISFSASRGSLESDTFPKYSSK